MGTYGWYVRSDYNEIARSQTTCVVVTQAIRSRLSINKLAKYVVTKPTTHAMKIHQILPKIYMRTCVRVSSVDVNAAS